MNSVGIDISKGKSMVAAYYNKFTVKGAAASRVFRRFVA